MRALRGQYINEDILIDEAEVIDRFTARPALDLFEGCLVGVAVGDAVGLGVEGADMDTCIGYTDDVSPQMSHAHPCTRGVLLHSLKRGITPWVKPFVRSCPVLIP